MIEDIVAVPIDIMYRPEYQADKRYYPKSPEQTNVIIKIQNDDGTEGIGEAAHSPGIYGETAAMTMAAIEYFKPFLVGADPKRLTKINADLDRQSPIGNVAARAGIDIALHDLVGKLFGLPVYQLLGGRVHDRLPTHINPATYEDTTGDMVRLLKEGFRAFKQKMSGDVAYDVQLVHSLLDAVPEDVVLSLDVNQGWSVRETLQVAGILERRRPYPGNVILEQPIDAADLQGAAHIRASTSIPLMLDDALRTVADVQRAIELRAADILSLKISRVGGIQRCQQMIKMAEAANVDYIVDEINEMRVANTAVAHLAMASRRPLYTGVCCHMLLERDIVTEGGVQVVQGDAVIGDDPGLGIRGLSL